MKKLLVLAAFLATLLVGGVSSASAAGQACYSVYVGVNGSPVVNEAGCQALP